jgi:hypothetical protein
MPGTSIGPGSANSLLNTVLGVMMTAIFVLSSDDQSALHFAANEARRYLQRMDGEVVLEVVPREQYQPDETGLWLGTFADVGLAAQSAHPLDDEIHIAVREGSGLIAGANPRSVLLALYRYLTELGCRWVRPGPAGEFIPRQTTTASVQLHEQPAYRHRAVCIEGAVSLENVLEMVDWLPKVGLSGYFMQFREGFTFFDRWYRHELNPLKTPEPFSVEQAQNFTRQIMGEVQKRDLVYHAVGHGWTTEAFGVACLGWDAEPDRAWPPEFLRYVAEVNGRRTVPRDIASIAALCYSDPMVHERLVSCIVEYAAAHPEIDLLHVWLDDGFNNKCECANCRQRRPADHYLDILNALDACLADHGLPHKIVFLAYVDMLWPPETVRIANPERFVFMFAPISRTYREPLRPSAPLAPLSPFELNHLQFPSDINGLLAFLQAWQEVVQGDSFIFDYHFWIGGLYRLDPGHMSLARMVSEDVKLLKSQGLNGLVSCQLQRVYFPTGLGMAALARTLWDASLDFDALMEDYFAGAFGPDGARCQAYLLELADLLDLEWLRGPDAADAADVATRCRSAFALLDEFAPVIASNLDLPEPCHARSWQYLSLHAEITRMLTRMLLAKAEGQQADFLAHGEQLKHFVCAHEDEVQPVLDVWAFVRACDRLLSST